MDSTFDKNQTSVKQSEETKNQEAERQTQSFESFDLSTAMKKLSKGAKLSDLTPKEAREVVKSLGNQTALELLTGGDSVPLSSGLPKATDNTEGLLDNPIDIRWPALTTTPLLERTSHFPSGCFSIENIRPMGYYNMQGGGNIERS